MKKFIKEIIVLLIQLFMFYIFPLFAGPTDAIGMVLFILLATFILSVIIGSVSNEKIKYFYPIIIAILFIPSIFIYYNESALIHSLWYLVDGYIGLLIGLIIKKISEKDKVKEQKLYNIIFPVYMLWLMPPAFIVFGILNFIIDSVVILITKKVLKINNIFEKYKKTILKVWGFGFLADFIGAFFLFFASDLAGRLDIPIRYNIDYNPLGNVYALLITIIGILISGMFIYIFNKKYSFKKIDITEREKKILSLTMAIVTAPYLFLLPTNF